MGLAINLLSASSENKSQRCGKRYSDHDGDGVESVHPPRASAPALADLIHFLGDGIRHMRLAEAPVDGIVKVDHPAGELAAAVDARRVRCHIRGVVAATVIAGDERLERGEEGGDGGLVLRATLFCIGIIKGAGMQEGPESLAPLLPVQVRKRHFCFIYYQAQSVRWPVGVGRAGLQWLSWRECR